jgi:hypothetical protein
MKITLTTHELEHAIGSYLRANAAVVVGEITFSLKKTGIETVVETTVKEIEPAEEVIPLQMVLDLEPARVTAMPASTGVPYVDVTPVETFETNPEELLDEPSEEIKTDEAEESVSPPWSEEAEELDAAIEAVEIASISLETVPLTFDSIIEAETVEEMLVVNSMSIADILGS